MPSFNAPTAARPVVQGAILASVLGAALAMPVAARADETPASDSMLADAGEHDVPIIVNGMRYPDANPNAANGAPLQIERSTNDRLTEPVRDTPRSITIIPRQAMEDIGANSFRDVARSTPGVTLGTGEGGNAFGDRIFIRGFEARNDVYIDGLRDPGVSSRELFAVEQVEVLRGPSGAFGGRGTTGGLVSLQSKQPVFGSSFARFDGGVGTSDYFRGTIDANAGTGPLAVRVNLLGQSADTPGRDYVYSRRTGGAVALAWRATDNLTVSADYYHFRLTGLPDYGVPFDVTTQRPYAVDRDNYYGVVGRDFLYNAADIGTVRVDYAPIDGLKMRAVGRWGRTQNSYVVGAPGAVCRFARAANGTCPTSGTQLPEAQFTVASGAQRRDAETEAKSALFDTTAEFETGPLRHTMVLGFEWGNETIDFYRQNIAAYVEDAAGNPGPVPSFVRNLINPDPRVGGRIPVDRDNSIAPTQVSIDTSAAYLIDTIHVGRAWALTLGARIDGYDIDLFNPDASNAPGLQPLSVASSSTLFNWQASLTYKPIEALTFYGSIATSANPSGEQIDGNGLSYDGLAPQTADLSPERNRSYEAGVKWQVADGRLLLTAAAFRIDKRDAREQVSPGVYANVGDLRAQGIELGVAGNVNSRIELFGSYTYNDATITASANPANVGRRFANVPQHSGSLLMTYALTSRVQIGGQVYAQDKVYGGSQAAGTSQLPAYVRFDAVARWRPIDALELRLNVLNVLDKTYYEAIYRSSSPFAYVAPGRSAMLTATIRL